MIIGILRQYFLLCTDREDALAAAHRFFIRLCHRGYNPDILRPLFTTALERIHRPNQATQTTIRGDGCFLHVPYHPRNPPREQLQALFHQHIYAPHNEPLLENLRNNEGVILNIDHMTIAYHRPPNLKNTLFPRKLNPPPNQPASSFLPPLPTNFSSPTQTETLRPGGFG
jgi:hypothetical protein